jgi:GT2 family glycosyltransferase
LKLSIITVNYRSWGHLETALLALADDFPLDWEMIVVDNESIPDDLREFSARFPWVTFVANPVNSGFGHGCNIGAARASGDRLLFMNPDVVARSGAIQSLMQVQDTHSIGIVAPKQLSSSGKNQKVFDDFPSPWNQSKTIKALLRILMPSRFRDPRKEYSELVECDWVTGSVLMISRTDFDAIGRWSEDYWMYVEDADLCRKAHNAGMRVAYTPDVEVIHAHGGSSRLNVDVKAMTKLEVIISKHVYTKHHTRGFERSLTHVLIFLLRMPMLIVAALLNLVTLGQIPVLRVRSRMCIGLMRYYAGVVRTGSWLSPRALTNQFAEDRDEKTSQ